MIRGNQLAIDLGLEVLLALRPGEAHSKTVIATFIDAAREVLELTEPFSKQDLFYLEKVALEKMRRHARERERQETRTLLVRPLEQAVAA